MPPASGLEPPSTTPAEGLWDRLPEELLLRVLGNAWWGNVRATSKRWREIHDGGCRALDVRDGMPDALMQRMCKRLPAITHLTLWGVQSLTSEGLACAAGLSKLAVLDLAFCSNVTDTVLRDLRHLTALTHLRLSGCCSVTDLGIQELSSTTALSKLCVYNTAVTEAGRAALKAALPTLCVLPEMG
jgi:hypothetical protein